MHSASWCGATISCGVSPRRWCKIGYACTSHATSVAHNDLIHWWWLVNVCEHVGVQRQTHSASNLPLKRCGKCQFRALTEPRRVTSVRVENHSSGRQRELSSLLWRVARVKANARAHRNMHTGTCTATCEIDNSIGGKDGTVQGCADTFLLDAAPFQNGLLSSAAQLVSAEK